MPLDGKRPLSYGKVEARIREGLDQLMERYESYTRPQSVRGILALSISKIENDGSKALNAQNPNTLHFAIRDILEKFRRTYSRIWENSGDDRTLAVLLHLYTPCFLNTALELVSYRQTVC